MEVIGNWQEEVFKGRENIKLFDHLPCARGCIIHSHLHTGSPFLPLASRLLAADVLSHWERGQPRVVMFQ